MKWKAILGVGVILALFVVGVFALNNEENTPVTKESTCNCGGGCDCMANGAEQCGCGQGCGCGGGASCHSS